MEADIIARQHIDPETEKVSLMLKLTKDYRRVKSLIKERL